MQVECASKLYYNYSYSLHYLLLVMKKMYHIFTSWVLTQIVHWVSLSFIPTTHTYIIIIFDKYKKGIEPYYIIIRSTAVCHILPT